MTHIHRIIIMITITKSSHSHEEQELFSSCWATCVSSKSTSILGGRRAASRRPALKIHEELLEDSQEHNIDLLYVPIGVRLTTEVRRSRERVTPGVTLAAALRYTWYMYVVYSIPRAFSWTNHVVAIGLFLCAFVSKRSGGNHLWPAVSRKRRTSELRFIDYIGVVVRCSLNSAYRRPKQPSMLDVRRWLISIHHFLLPSIWNFLLESSFAQLAGRLNR